MSQMIYEGKAKRVWSTDHPEKLRIEFKNSLTAFNALKKGEFEGKGEVNCEITALIYEYLRFHGVPSHMIEKLSNKELLCHKLKMIPLEVVVRNVLAGSTAKKFGLEEGKKLPKPLCELFFKDDALQDPFVNDDQMVILGYATRDEVDEVKRLALDVNTHLHRLFDKVGIDLVDFKLEFGKTSDGRVVLGDEITPDSCRLWDRETKEKLDKDRFRRDLGKVEESYREVLGRLKKELAK